MLLTEFANGKRHPQQQSDSTTGDCSPRSHPPESHGPTAIATPTALVRRAGRTSQRRNNCIGTRQLREASSDSTTGDCSPRSHPPESHGPTAIATPTALSLEARRRQWETPACATDRIRQWETPPTATESSIHIASNKHRRFILAEFDSSTGRCFILTELLF